MLLFDSGRPFYKGNLHLHTTQSDGKRTPEQAMEIYQQQGYDFLAITDHWKCMPEQRYKNMLVLSGIELDYNLPGQVIHIVGVGVDQSITEQVERKQSAQTGIYKIRESGGRAILAHPHWSLNTSETIASLRDLTAAEIYNSVSGMPWNGARADSSNILDVAAAQGHPLNFVASDDTHFYTGEECKSFIRLQAESLTTQGIIDALDAGRFYASRGPSFYQIELTDDTLTIDCSPVSRIVFSSDLPYVKNRCTDGDGMTHAEYTLQRARHETCVRCTIYDENGTPAWTSPFVIKYQ